MPAIEKRRSVSGPVMRTSLRGVHPGDQGLERPGQPRVVEVADVEVEVLEGLGAHPGLLGHARRWAGGGRTSGCCVIRHSKWTGFWKSVLYRSIFSAGRRPSR